MNLRAMAFTRGDQAGEEYRTFMNHFNMDIEERAFMDPTASRLKIIEAPSIALPVNNDYKIRYYGKPEGREEGAFMDILTLLRAGNVTLSNSTLRCINQVQIELSIKLYVTPICPYCPHMVKWLTQMAYINGQITLDIINLFDFPGMAEKEDIMAVPYLIINNKYRLLGFHQEDLLCMHILAALGQLYQ